MENYYTSSTLLFPLAALSLVSCNSQKKEEVRQPNIIFMMTDDHTTQAMSCYGGNLIQTPNMDRMAKEGAHIKNAFVTTSLSSPSRASILTGMYSHSHKVVDNAAPLPDGLIFFPQYLQECGYKTAFFGKWHMGNDSGAPQPGFDHWEGFKGQGEYYNPRINTNGEWIQYKDSTYLSLIHI